MEPIHGHLWQSVRLLALSTVSLVRGKTERKMKQRKEVANACTTYIMTTTLFVCGNIAFSILVAFLIVAWVRGGFADTVPDFRINLLMRPLYA